MRTEKRNMRLKAMLRSSIFSIVLMAFPVASGVIVTVKDIGTPQKYWVQGIFMLLSLIVPISIVLITRTYLSQIGFTKTKIDSMKPVLYFIPIIAAKTGFLFFGFNSDIKTIIALAFFTTAIGLSEEIYFRGLILTWLRACFSIKQAVILSSALFAAVHASQAFSGADLIMVTLTIVNALIFGIVASEIVIITGSLIPVIIWHALYDFINWMASVRGTTEIILIVVQSIIIIFYGIYLWPKMPDRPDCLL